MQIGAVYLRVSTEEQTEYSPEAQLNAIKEYARKNNILISGDFIYRDEGVSGRKAEKRPAFQAMVAAAKSKPPPFEVILVHKFDRFARNREDSIVYKSLLRKECGVKVISITEPLDDDKMSVIIEAMLEAMAEYYSLNLSEEVKKGMFEKARRGENIGKAPYGYMLVNSKLVPNENEAAIVKKIFNMYQQESLSKIVQHLNMNGYETRTKGRWTQHTISYILGNPVYHGVLRYNYRKGGLRSMENKKEDWILAPSDHIPLISSEIYEKTQEKLALSKALYNRNFSEKTIKSWMQHLTRCAVCDSILTISSSIKKRYKTFRCSRVSLGTCRVTNTFSVRKLQKVAIDRIKQDFKQGENLVIEKISKPENEDLLNILNARLKKINTKKELIRKAYLAEVDSLEEYKKNKAEVEREESEIVKEIEGVNFKQSPGVSAVIPFGNFVSLLDNEELSLEERNKTAKQFIKRVDFNLRTKEINIVYYA